MFMSKFKVILAYIASKIILAHVQGQIFCRFLVEAANAAGSGAKHARQAFATVSHTRKPRLTPEIADPNKNYLLLLVFHSCQLASIVIVVSSLISDTRKLDHERI